MKNQPAKRRKRSPLFDQLAALVPCLAFSKSRRIDEDGRWDGDGPDPRDDGAEVYAYTVSAKAIVNGEEYEGEAFLGNSFYYPGEDDSDIGGYLAQMLDEAADDLAKTLARAQVIDNVLYAQIDNARDHIKREMRKSYEAQRAEIAARG